MTCLQQRFSYLNLKSGYLGRARPMNNENPKTKRFLPECKEQFLRFDNPTPVIIPNMTKNRPPTTGSGIVTNSDENFPHNENTMSKIPATKNASKLQYRHTRYWR